MRLVHILLIAVLHALLLPLSEAGKKGAHFRVMQRQRALAGAADTLSASKENRVIASTKARAAISTNRMKKAFSTGESLKAMDPIMIAFKQKRSRIDEWDGDRVTKK